MDQFALEYTIQASDEEYTVETEGEFVFKNNTLSIGNDITPLSFRLHQKNYPNPFLIQLQHFTDTIQEGLDASVEN